MAEEIKKAETAEKTAETEQAETREYVVTLKTPYKFEGREYAEIDLTGLERLTVMDAVNAQKALFSAREVATAMVTENTTAFAREMAQKATSLPIEFFRMMPRGADKKIARIIRGFLNEGETTEGHVMKLEKPYFFRGQEYREIDLSNVGNMTSMHESTAENKMAEMGFIPTENSWNYYYACCIASMATGEPEEFFTGLPLKELLKLKNAVNDADFFE